MNRLARTLALLGLVVGMATSMSCSVNDYCLNCATNDGGGDGDGGTDPDGGNGDGGVDPDAPDGGPCVPSGNEVCDDKDNDCDGQTDEDVDLSEPCTQVGECAGAVRQCVNGVLGCSKPPQQEACDRLDNNCNGMVDEGDPGGGARCGSDLGECVAGTLHCNPSTGVVECQGSVGTPGANPEACNGLDDDCDGNFDEGMMNLGSCGMTDTGECSLGTRRCVGGGVQCVGEQGPTFELCDNLDQDCDGNPTNGYNLNTDPSNCGACGNSCSVPNANAGCGGSPPRCTVGSCQPGYHDIDGMAANGCEYACNPNGAETCNGRDDDCDGLVDENITPPQNFCASQGECASGTTVSCSGMGGWKCTYTDPDVVVDANGNIVPETRCDGKDNDCDGTIDDGQPNKGQACDNGQQGVCRSSGTFTCDPQNMNGPAVCTFTTTGGTSSAETCDGLDNDCDGTIDDGAAAGTLPGQEFVTIPGTTAQIMKYEASRPGATATATGTISTHVCSKPGVQPWTNVTYPQAVAACASIGARMCTEAEWQNMCIQVGGPPTYPVAGPTSATDHVFIEAEHAATRVAGTTGDPWVNETFSAYSGTGNVVAGAGNNNDGDSVTQNNADVQSSRLEFPMTFTAGDYYVWVRAVASSTNDNDGWVGINRSTTVNPNAGFSTGSDTIWRWVRHANPITVPAGESVVRIYMRDDGMKIDAIAVSRDGTNPPPQDARVWAYGTNPKVPQPQTCNVDDVDTNTQLAGDQDDILATGSRAACFANGTGANDAFDMTGNVKEWTLRRAAGQNPLRGGASNNEVAGSTCQLNFTLADDQFFFPNVGFRCCK